MSEPKLCEQIGSRLNNENACKILLHFLVGVIVTVILVSVKLYIETLPIGHRVELLTYEFLNSQIPAFSPEVEMPVVVLDISQIPGGKSGTVTSRETLKEIINELINQKVRAIAIDIDFSPNDKGWIDKKDPQFFEFCLEQRQKGIPILLGVYRTAFQKPENWLGSDEFKDLAANIAIDTNDTSRMPLWIQNKQEQKLFSLSSGLINAVNVKPKEPSSFIKFALEEPDHSEIIDTKGEIKSSSLLTNYSKLEAIHSQSLSAISTNSIRDLGSKFQNKLVIIGDGKFGEATDTFNIPGRNEPIPGVYLHASAVYTQTIEPFFELKHNSKIIIDLSLGLIILIIITVIRWRNTDKNLDLEKKQKRFIWIAIIFSLIIGVIAVRVLSILWLDFFLVIFALFLHPTVEKGIGKLFKTHN